MELRSSYDLFDVNANRKLRSMPRRCYRRMKVNDFLRLCELQRHMQEDLYVSEEDIYALEDEFVSAYGELPSCHVCGETGHITFQCPYRDEYCTTPTHPQYYHDSPSIHSPQPLSYESQYQSRPHPIEFEYSANFCPTTPHYYEPYPYRFSRSPENAHDHVDIQQHLRAVREDYGYPYDYDYDFDYDSDDDMDVYPARPTPTTKSTCREDESQAAPPTPISVPEEILDPMTHYNEDIDGGGHDQDHICHDDVGLPAPDDTKDHKGEEVLAILDPVVGHDAEEGTSSLLETRADDIDDVDTFMSSKNDDTGYIPLTTPTMQEDAMEQESEEGMEDVRTKAHLKTDPMVLEKKDGSTRATRMTTSVCIPLYPYTTFVMFSVTTTTPFEAKDRIGARIWSRHIMTSAPRPTWTFPYKI